MAEPIAPVGDLAGICGHDGTDWLKVAVDANGYLKVVGGGVAGAIEVTQDTPGDLLVGSHQYDGSNWRKSNLLWGYHEVLLEQVLDTNADAGLNTLDATAVPSGEVHYVTSVYAANNTTNPSVIAMGITRGATTYSFKRVTLPGAGTSVESTNPVVLKQGDKIRVSISGCVAGDTIIMNIFGYIMDIDM
jgi:hypothetical protein